MSSEQPISDTAPVHERRLSSIQIKRLVAAGIALVVLVAIGIPVGYQLSLATVPDLIGQKLSDARSGMNELGLRYSTESDFVIDTADAEFFVVASQEPPPGTRLGRGSRVSLGVKASMPDLLGVTVEQAGAMLRVRHLSLAETVGEVPGGLDAFFNIAEQSPPAGTAVAIDGQVEYTTVAQAVAVPDLVGKPYTSDLGAGSGVILAATMAPVIPAGTVLEDGLLERILQSPKGWQIVAQGTEAGTSVEAGSVVAISVAVPVVAVPDLRQLSGAAAEQALRQAGLRPAIANKDLTTWKVTSQSPAPGSLVLPGSTVNGTATAPQIVFEVTGDGSRALITWIAPGGSFSIQQDANARIPWSISFDDRGFRSYEQGNFSAQMHNGSWITCTRYSDGRVVEQQTSTGSYAVVMCG